MADGKCHLSFNILKTKHATKYLTTDITITSKVLMDKPKKKYTAILFTLAASCWDQVCARNLSTACRRYHYH